MSAVSLAPRALYEEAAELLRQRIFSHELAPGSWINELKIAQDYGISRTPLREALKVLAGEGLVTMKMRRGAYVTEVSKRDLEEIYHLLGLLESDAAGMVAQKATFVQMTQLQECQAALELSAQPERFNREQFFLANEQFHMLLLTIADNRWRNQIVTDLRKVMKLNRHNSLLKFGRVKQSLIEHRALMAALLARDTELSQKRMLEHFRNGLEAAD